NQSNLFLPKYSTDSDVIWAGGVGGSGYAQGLDIVIDTNAAMDKLCLTGFYTDTMDFDLGTGVAQVVGTNQVNAFIAKYDTSGAYVWAKGMTGAATPPRSISQGWGIAVDTQSNVIITGFLAGTVDFDP